MGKGRNKRLIAKRDEALIRRYLYWTETEWLRFDDALKMLSENEFFVSVQRVLRIIQDYHDRMEEIRASLVPKVLSCKVIFCDRRKS